MDGGQKEAAMQRSRLVSTVALIMACACGTAAIGAQQDGPASAAPRTGTTDNPLPGKLRVL